MFACGAVTGSRAEAFALTLFVAEFAHVSSSVIDPVGRTKGSKDQK